MHQNSTFPFYTKTQVLKYMKKKSCLSDVFSISFLGNYCYMLTHYLIFDIFKFSVEKIKL